MPGFGQLAYSQGSPQYLGLPIEDIKAVSRELTDRYNVNESTSDQIKTYVSSIPHRNVDRKIVTDAASLIDQGVNQIVEDKSFHRSGRQIKDMAIAMQSNKGLQMAQSDYAAQVENYKNIDSKKGWSEEQKNAIKAIAEANSTGVVYDPVTNEAKSGFNGYNIDDAPDLTELNSLMALMKSNKEGNNTGFTEVAAEN